MNAPPLLVSGFRGAGSPVAPPASLTTLVVHCSDSRLGHQCDRFVHCRLGQAPYERLIMPGGAAWMTERPELEAESAAAEDALEMLAEAHPLRRAVLIAHADCVFYRDRLGIPPEQCEVRQRADLLAAGRWLRRRRPGLQVAGYYARRRGARVEFQLVFGSAGLPLETRLSRFSLPVENPPPPPPRLREALALPAGVGFS